MLSVNLSLLFFAVENGLEGEDSEETKLDDDKNELDDDIHSPDLCSSSCSDIENHRDDSFHGNKEAHDISGCEVEAMGEAETERQHTKPDVDKATRNVLNQEKLQHGK